MNWVTCSCMAIVFAMVSTFSNAVAAPSLETYGRLPNLEMVAISPDGSRLAFVHTSGEKRTLLVMGIKDRKSMGRFGLADLKVRDLAWADTGHLLVTTSVTAVPWEFRYTKEWLQLLVCDTTTWKAQVIPASSWSGGPRLLNAILGNVMVRTVSGQTAVFFVGVGTSGGRAYPVLLRRELDSGRERVIAEGDEETHNWLVNLRGEIAVELKYVEKRQRWGLSIRKEGHLEEVASGQEAIDLPDLVGMGRTNDQAIIQIAEGGRTSWKLLSLTDGSIAPEPDVMARLSIPLEDHVTHQMAGGAYIDDSTQFAFFDGARQAQWEAIASAFHGDLVSFVSASDDFRKVVVRVDGPNHGYGYELVDLDTGQALPIGDIYEGITRPFETRRITYSARDGLKIPAYLTLPGPFDSDSKGVAQVPLPLIVLVHGGPKARDTAEFDWLAQALADQGYAVLQANFRGSALDSDFVRAGFGEFGRKMQSDLVDGVRHLVSLGLVDPARVCIAGASYGGYAALAGVALDTSTYRCAVSIAGVSDLRAFLRHIHELSGRQETSSERFWDRYIGVSGPKDPLLDQLSPLGHAAAVNVPVLLIHGHDDTVVPYDQSASMYQALRGLGKDAELVELEHEDHWLSRGATRLKMLLATVKFLRAHNPPEPK